MEHYTDLKDMRQKEISKLPIFFAFADWQFKEQMEKRGLRETDVDKIYGLPCGGFCLRTDYQKIKDFFMKPNPVLEHMSDPAFAEEAFLYEMKNHEYHINFEGDWEVCREFGKVEYSTGKDYTDYLKELGYDDEIIKAYETAMQKFYKIAEKWK